MKKIRDWKELSEVEDSEKFSLDIVPEKCCGFIVDKETGKKGYYLSTHTFYESTHEHRTKILQEHGFDVELVSWH